jgi:hypothetical protein
VYPVAEKLRRKQNEKIWAHYREFYPEYLCRRLADRLGDKKRSDSLVLGEALLYPFG